MSDTTTGRSRSQRKLEPELELGLMVEINVDPVDLDPVGARDQTN